MRKFSLFTLLATLFCCLTASAQCYILGEVDGHDWDPTKAAELQQTADGVYAGEVNFTGSYFSITTKVAASNENGSGWSEIASFRYGATSGNFSVTLDQPMTIQKGENAFKLSASGKYEVEVNFNTNKLTVKDNGQEVEYSYEIWSSFVSSTNWDSTPLSEENGKWVAKNVEVVNAAAEFGIRPLANGGPSDWYAAPSAVTVSGDTEITLTNDGAKNIKIEKGTYNFSLDAENMVLSITKEGSEVDPPVGPEDPEFVIYFDNYDNWSTTAPKVWAWNADGDFYPAWPGVEMTLVDGTLYKWESDKTPTGIIITNENESKAGGGDIKNPVNGATYYSNGLTTKPVEGEIRVAITGDFNGWSETANSTTEYGDEGLKRYYIDVENYAGGDNGFKVVVNGKYYGQDGLVLSNGGWVDGITAPEGYGNNITLPASAEGTNVRFMVNLGDDTVNLCAVWVAVPTITYNVAEQDDTFVEFTLSTEGENKIFYQIAGAAAEGMAKAEGEYTEYVAGETLKVNEGETFSAYAQNGDMKSAMVNKTFAQMHSEAVGSGVAAIEIENGAARYFNLEGMEVLNPENGIYIRVANGKAQKVLVK